VKTDALERTVVGWNRSHLDPMSDEVLAQVLDRGDPAAGGSSTPWRPTKPSCDRGSCA
jgi:transposase InsO family protein